MNKADSERLAGYLESKGWKTAPTRAEAGVVVLNTCGVRQSAEDRVYGLVRTIRQENPKAKLAITGCLATRKDVQARLKGKVDWWIPIGEISNLKFLISKRFKNLKPDNSIEIRNPCLRRQAKSETKNSAECDYLNKKPKYSSSFTAFIPIGNGCDNFCSYCVVPYARGRESWRPAQDIIREVMELVKNGYKEINLIAQNVNSYKSKNRGESKTRSRLGGRDDKTVYDFAKLLKAVNDIPGDFWIRFATSHPKDMSGELIKTIAKCEKVCEHVHLPVQAGDNAVLKKMNRKYMVKHYRNLIEKIRKLQITNYKLQINRKSKIQNYKTNTLPIAITTDVIVGFPGETRKQLENTKKLFREIKFDQAYIARYSPRPGTAAVKLSDDVPLEEKKRREKELEKIVGRSALANNKKYLGRIVKILIEGRNKKGEWYGRTSTNKNTDLNGKGNNIKAGDIISVKITEARVFGLRGKILNKKEADQ